MPITTFFGDFMSSTHNADQQLVHNVVAMWRLRTNPVRLSWARIRNAAKIDDIVDGLDPAIIDRASGVKLIDQDHIRETNTLRYQATSGGPTYTVVVRAIPADDSQNRVDKADVEVSCSCKHWRWGGCEHHAEKGEYLYQSQYARGDLSTPDIRDPEGTNYVCKHVYRAFQEARKVYIDYESPGRSLL